MKLVATSPGPAGLPVSKKAGPYKNKNASGNLVPPTKVNTASLLRIAWYFDILSLRKSFKWAAD